VHVHADAAAYSSRAHEIDRDTGEDDRRDERETARRRPGVTSGDCPHDQRQHQRLNTEHVDEKALARAGDRQVDDELRQYDRNGDQHDRGNPIEPWRAAEEQPPQQDQQRAGDAAEHGVHRSVD